MNHRDLNDPVQSKIENIIKENVKNFGYGRRREDQTSEINRSGLFEDVIRIQGDVVHKQSCEDLIVVWKSHASLERQAGSNFGKIIDEISSFIYSLDLEEIEVPYTTYMGSPIGKHKICYHDKVRDKSGNAVGNWTCWAEYG